MRLPFAVDFGRAAFAVALAVLLYFVALAETNRAEQRETAFTVPVQTVNVPPVLVITTQQTAARLWMTAPLNVFTRIRPERFTA